MFLCSDRRAGSSASGIVRPASFYEAQTETTAQAVERCALVMPSVCLLCTVDWWLKQHKKAEWGLSPLGFLAAVSPSADKKTYREVYKRALCTCNTIYVFEEFSFCHLQKPKTSSRSLYLKHFTNLLLQFTLFNAVFTHDDAVFKQKILSFCLNCTLNQSCPILITIQFVKKSALRHN